MRGKTLNVGLTAALAICSGCLFATSAWAAPQETVLHNFRLTLPRRAQPNDGCVLLDGKLITDAAGNLYGTTSSGGFFRYGTAFKLTPTDGGWTEDLLFNFGRDDASGTDPSGGLVFDGAGNLYGTTEAGGDSDAGVVFELVPNADGSWTEQVPHSFNGADGSRPWATVIFDAAGNLYGTTEMGGAYNKGTVFELTPTGGGDWSEQVLHSFGSGTDGSTPLAPLVFDTAGNLYGTTSYGGQYLGGTAFQLSPAIGGGWTEQILHEFGSGVDGEEPFSGALIFDSSGSLYGTTFTGGTHHLCQGGSSSCGTVYKLTHTGGGDWAEQVLYNFNGSPDANFPTSSLVFDAAGNLYGTTFFGGGGRYDAGTVFKLTPGAVNWSEQVLYSFSGLEDGDNPKAGLILDGEGNLYGTTQAGGAYSCGVVFEVTP